MLLTLFSLPETEGSPPHPPKGLHKVSNNFQHYHHYPHYHYIKFRKFGKALNSFSPRLTQSQKHLYSQKQNIKMRVFPFEKNSLLCVYLILALRSAQLSLKCIGFFLQYFSSFAVLFSSSLSFFKTKFIEEEKQIPKNSCPSMKLILPERPKHTAYGRPLNL